MLSLASLLLVWYKSLKYFAIRSGVEVGPTPVWMQCMWSKPASVCFFQRHFKKHPIGTYCCVRLRGFWYDGGVCGWIRKSGEALKTTLFWDGARSVQLRLQMETRSSIGFWYQKCFEREEDTCVDIIKVKGRSDSRLRGQAFEKETCFLSYATCIVELHGINQCSWIKPII
jgi:hypothetical protein